MGMHGDVFVFIGTYGGEDAALSDYEAVRRLHAVGAVGTFDAALVTKDPEGRVHAVEVEAAARHAGWGGVVVGAMVGLLFPPAMIATALAGGAAGVVGGHLWRGMSRSDVREVGELVDAGEVALLVVGEHGMEQTLDVRGFRAENVVVTNLHVPRGGLDAALREAAGDVSQHGAGGPAPPPGAQPEVAMKPPSQR